MQVDVHAPEATPATLDAAYHVGRLDVAQRHAKSLAMLAQCTENSALKPKDAVQFFCSVERPNPSNPQQMKGVCTNCFATVTSTGSSRFVTHLSGCALCPFGVRQALPEPEQVTLDETLMLM